MQAYQLPHMLGLLLELVLDMHGARCSCDRKVCKRTAQCAHFSDCYRCVPAIMIAVRNHVGFTCVFNFVEKQNCKCISRPLANTLTCMHVFTSPIRAS
jgi:hypothetical protein